MQLIVDGVPVVLMLQARQAVHNNVHSDSDHISTDEVEMYCHRSRDRYLMVTKLRNYSTTTKTTMTKFTLSRKAISLGANPKK